MPSSQFSEQDLHDLVTTHPGASSQTLAASAGAPSVEVFVDHAARIARSSGVGQDDSGAWWTLEQQPAVLRDRLARTGTAVLAPRAGWGEQ